MSGPAAQLLQQYDFPLFCGLWLPARPGPEADSDGGPQLILLGGGGGAGAHGVRNRLALAAYDPAKATLLPELAGEATGADAAQAAAVHSRGAGLLVAFSEPGPLRRYELHRGPPLRLLPEAALPASLQGVGEQRVLAFSPSGDLLAMGGQDGAVRVVEWPSARVRVHLREAHTADVRSLDFSADERFLASTSRSAACPVWDLHNGGAQAALLTAPQGCTVSAVRFSRSSPPSAYLGVQRSGHAWVHAWAVDPWAYRRRAHVHSAPLSALALSPSGALLACASAEGDIAVLSTPHLALLLRVRRAHPLFITGLDFSPDSQALLSISADSSARVTDLQLLGQGSVGWDLLLALLVALLAAVLALLLHR